MNILVLNWQDWTNPLSGGAEIHLKEIFSRIASMGHNVTLITSRHTHSKQQETLEGINIVRIGSRSTFNYRLFYYYCTRLRKLNFDIVVDDVNKIPFFTPLFVRRPTVAITHHFFGKTIFDEVGYLAGIYVLLGELLFKYIYKHTTILTVSESTKKELSSWGFKPENCKLAHNAINHSMLYPDHSARSQQPAIGYVGRLKRYKKIEHLLYAFQKLLITYPSLTLFIIGKGDNEKSLRVLAHKLGIYDSTKFIGFISENNKRQMLQSLWVIVNPSAKEGWGITNIEANGCGTPTIVANSPGLRDSVREGISGLMYTYGNVSDLTSKISTVLSSALLRDRLGKGGVAFASEFTWDNTAKQVISVLEQELSKR